MASRSELIEKLKAIRGIEFVSDDSDRLIPCYIAGADIDIGITCKALDPELTINPDMDYQWCYDVLTARRIEEPEEIIFADLLRICTALLGVRSPEDRLRTDGDIFELGSESGSGACPFES